MLLRFSLKMINRDITHFLVCSHRKAFVTKIWKLHSSVCKHFCLLAGAHQKLISLQTNTDSLLLPTTDQSHLEGPFWPIRVLLSIETSHESYPQSQLPWRILQSSRFRLLSLSGRGLWNQEISNSSTYTLQLKAKLGVFHTPAPLGEYHKRRNKHFAEIMKWDRPDSSEFNLR